MCIRDRFVIVIRADKVVSLSVWTVVLAIPLIYAWYEQVQKL